MTSMQNTSALPAWLHIERDPEQYATFRAHSNRFDSTEDIVKHVRPLIERRENETAIVVLLDAYHTILGMSEVTRGSAEEVMLPPRDVFRLAVAMGAQSVILVHNHPTDDVTPSNADIQTTDHLRMIGQYLGVEVLDHIIVGPTQHMSMRFGPRGFTRNRDYDRVETEAQKKMARQMFERPAPELNPAGAMVVPKMPTAALHIRRHRRKDQPDEVKYDGRWRRLIADRGNYVYVEWGSKSAPYGQCVPKAACA